MLFICCTCESACCCQETIYLCWFSCKWQLIMLILFLRKCLWWIVCVHIGFICYRTWWAARHWSKICRLRWWWWWWIGELNVAIHYMSELAWSVAQPLYLFVYLFIYYYHYFFIGGGVIIHHNLSRMTMYINFYESKTIFVNHTMKKNVFEYISV